MILLRFVNNPPKKPVARFADKLFAEEGPGILNWMVQGAVKCLSDLAAYGRIHLPPSLQEDADELLYKSDSVHNFVMDCVKSVDGGALISAEAYQPYIRYCNENGFIALTRETFFRTLA